MPGKKYCVWVIFGGQSVDCPLVEPHPQFRPKHRVVFFGGEKVKEAGLVKQVAVNFAQPFRGKAR